MDVNEMMKQAQKMQERLQKSQDELYKAEVTGASGGGLVSIVMNGHHDAKKVTIDSSLMTEEKELLEDLVAAAVNDAVRKIEAKNKENMSGMAAGMGLPPEFKLPF